MSRDTSLTTLLPNAIFTVASAPKFKTIFYGFFGIYCLSDEWPLKHTIASSMEFCWWGWYKDKKACDSLSKIGQSSCNLSCPGCSLGMNLWLSL